MIFRIKEVVRMFVSGLSQNHQMFHVGAANRSIAKQTEAITGKRPEYNQDRATISPEGKKQSMIEQLMKQKQQLMDRKSELMAKSAETGQRMDSQIQQYEKQIEELNQQISELQTDKEDEKKAEENKDKLQYEKPKTEQEVEKEKMGKIAQIANAENHVDTITSVKDKIDGQIRVLHSEIELSAKSGGNVEAKLKKVAELEGKSNDLANQIGKKTMDIVEDLAENNKVENTTVIKENEIEEQEEKEQQKNGIEALQDPTEQVKEDRLSI